MAAILSHVEKRRVANDYTIRRDSQIYQIDRRDIRTGMRKGWVRVGQHLDGTIAVRFQGKYVQIRRCEPMPGRSKAPEAAARKAEKLPVAVKRKSDWMKNFSLQSGLSLGRAVRISNARS